MKLHYYNTYNLVYAETYDKKNQFDEKLEN